MQHTYVYMYTKKKKINIQILLKNKFNKKYTVQIIYNHYLLIVTNGQLQNTKTKKNYIILKNLTDKFYCP